MNASPGMRTRMQVAIVIGASSGIGLDLVKRLIASQVAHLARDYQQQS